MKKKVNYHGYISIPRQFKHFLYELDPALFHLYMVLVLEAVWDQKKDEFGYVLRTNDELANLCNCNQSTVSRNLKKLQEKNFIVKDKNRIVILDYVMFLLHINKRLAKKNFASMHELRAFMRNNYACKHKSIGKYLDTTDYSSY